MATYHHGNLRQALLTRATQIIEDSGIEALSLRAMARDLKVSSTAPARHFKSRIDLLQNIAKEGYKQATVATLGALEQADPDPIARLNAMARAFVLWSLDNHALYTAIFHPDVSRHADEDLRQALADFASVVRASLAEAQGAGWRADEDPDILFHYAIAAIRGVSSNCSDTLYTSVVGPVNKADAIAVVDAIFPV
jgi:AcrR family transcriptional regulator